MRPPIRVVLLIVAGGVLAGGAYVTQAAIRGSGPTPTRSAPQARLVKSADLQVEMAIEDDVLRAEEITCTEFRVVEPDPGGQDAVVTGAKVYVDLKGLDTEGLRPLPNPNQGFWGNVRVRLEWDGDESVEGYIQVDPGASGVRWPVTTSPRRTDHLIVEPGLIRCVLEPGPFA